MNTENHLNNNSEKDVGNNNDPIAINKKPSFLKSKWMLRLSLFFFISAAILISAYSINLIVKDAEGKSTELTKPTNLPEPLISVATEVIKKSTNPVSLTETNPSLITSPTPTKRTEVIKYEVVTGDTIFGIAEKFGLQPETVLWSNRYTLGDTPDGLYPGFNLVILPEDGVYHMWSTGEGLNGVSSFYGVEPDVIVDYPLNNLDRRTIGDFSNPNIIPGTMLVVPGGRRPNITWVIARDNPAIGSAYLGPGVCAATLYGNVGTGTFVFPTPSHALSGYDWNPPVHNGLDFEGRSGTPIFASDSGVVVYSGWSDRGYGNLIVIDHDDGWQTMYAHLLDGSFVPCGTNVVQGEQIGLMGSTGNSTGPHLHFEIRYNGSAVNPWNYLQ